MNFGNLNQAQVITSDVNRTQFNTSDVVKGIESTLDVNEIPSNSGTVLEVPVNTSTITSKITSDVISDAISDVNRLCSNLNNRPTKSYTVRFDEETQAILRNLQVELGLSVQKTIVYALLKVSKLC